jgi:hypothetical protein
MHGQIDIPDIIFTGGSLITPTVFGAITDGFLGFLLVQGDSLKLNF